MYSGHRDGIPQRNMCHANYGEEETTNNGKIELPSQEKIRMFGEK